MNACQMVCTCLRVLNDFLFNGLDEGFDLVIT